MAWNDVVGFVAPYTGAWIEIVVAGATITLSIVAPYTGAWIEMLLGLFLRRVCTSHPTRVRGLK